MIAWIVALVKDRVGTLNLVLMVAGFTVVSLFIWHYNSIISERDTLRKDNATLESTVKTQKDTINKAVAAIGEWKDSQTKLINKIDEMSKVSADANKSVKRLTTIFAKHDLGKLSSKHPELIQDLINRGTADNMRLLSCASGDTDCTP